VVVVVDGTPLEAVAVDDGMVVLDVVVVVAGEHVEAVAEDAIWEVEVAARRGGTVV
jgi:hypothetical protein